MNDDCKICHGTKHIFKKGIGYDCECLKKQKHFQNLMEAGVKEEIADFTWEKVNKNFYKKEGVIEAFMEFSKKLVEGGVGKSFIIMGGEGTGKTLFAALIISDLIKVKKTCFVVDLETLVQATFEKDEDQKTLVKKCWDVNYLCIELGYENKHMYNSSVIKKFYRKRKEQNKITFFTSKYDMQELQVHYDVKDSPSSSEVTTFKILSDKRKFLRFVLE